MADEQHGASGLLFDELRDPFGDDAERVDGVTNADFLRRDVAIQ